jgi:uncharacterized protein YuzE
MIKKIYDSEADAFYMKCKKGKVARTEDKGNYLVDFDTKGNILGYEVLNYSTMAEKLRAIDGIALLPPKKQIF